MSLTPSHKTRLHPALKWGAPIAIFLYPAILIIPSLNWEADIYREYGLVESLSNVFLFVAIVFSFRSIILPLTIIQRTWVSLFVLGCILFLGEEISWGQHYIEWKTPEAWSEMNNQNETNLHNLQGWPEFLFSKIARNGLSIGLIIGSVVAPWWLRKNPQFCIPGKINFWLWPSSESAIVAILAVASNLPKRLLKNFGVEIPWLYYGPADGELKECLFALFIMMYAIVLLRTLRAQAQT